MTGRTCSKTSYPQADLRFRTEDFALDHEVPFFNASAQLFQGLRVLLDDQVAAERRPAALVRLRKYVGVEPGYPPFAELLKQREIEQVAKPGVIYPSRQELETELGRNSNYVEGIADLFKKYKLAGWEPAYEKLKLQMADYDAWIRANILPKARTDFRLPPAKNALAFEGWASTSPAQIAKMAHPRCPIPDRDGAPGRANCESERLCVQRLSRCDCQVKKKQILVSHYRSTRAGCRRSKRSSPPNSWSHCPPAAIINSPPQPRQRHSQRPVAAALPQHRSAAIRAAAQHSVRDRRRGGQVRRFHLRECLDLRRRMRRGQVTSCSSIPWSARSESGRFSSFSSQCKRLVCIPFTCATLRAGRGTLLTLQLRLLRATGLLDPNCKAAP